MSGDAVQTWQNLREYETLFRWGILSDMVMLGSYVLVTAMLYRLFRKISPALSLLGVLFSAVGIALLASCLLALIASLFFLESAGILHSWSQAQIAEGAYGALRLHSAGYNLTGFFFGPYCLLLGSLIVRSRWLPLALGLLMMLAGCVFIFDAALVLVAPEAAQSIPDAVMLISLVAEGSLALWLTFFGARRPKLPVRPVAMASA